MTSDRVLISEYCDDIRFEAGNKYSMMGCYTNELIANKLPIILPKFCIVSTAITPIEKPFKKLIFKAYLNNDLLYENNIPTDDLENGQKELNKKVDEDSTRFSVKTQIIFAPLPVEEESILHVEIETDEGTIKGSKLRIRPRNKDDV